LSQLPNPAQESFAEGDTYCRYAKLILLDQKQWLYVEKRYNLTPREREIAELICQGLQNGSIARHLRIRPGTVKTHTRNIYRKTQVKSKIAMLLRFVAASRELTTQYEGTNSIPITD